RGRARRPGARAAGAAGRRRQRQRAGGSFARGRGSGSRGRDQPPPGRGRRRSQRAAAGGALFGGGVPAADRGIDSVRGALLAEWIKFSRRPSSWILTLAMLSVVVGVGYVLLYLVFHFTPASPTFPESARKALLRVLYPDRFVFNVLNEFTGIGGAMVLILGSLSLGSEYSWSTLKTALTQRPGRLTFIAAKLLLLGLVVIGYVALLLAVGAAASLVAARLDGVQVSWPQAPEILRGLGAGSLMLGVWCALGLCLA